MNGSSSNHIFISFYPPDPSVITYSSDLIILNGEVSIELTDDNGHFKTVTINMVGLVDIE